MASIMAQTLTDWELIVCDSYSDDGTWEYIGRYADDPRVRMHRVPRAGLYAGWNECLRRATGDFIYIATADDTMSPDCLEKLSGALENAKRIDSKIAPQSPFSGLQSTGSTGSIGSTGFTGVCDPSDAGGSPPRAAPAEIAVCDFEFIDESGRILEPRPRRVPGDGYGDWMLKPHWRPGAHEFLVHLCLGVSWTTMTAVMFRRRLLDRAGYFPENCGAHGDKVWAIATALFSDTVYVPGRLATWRRHGEQSSSRSSVREWKHTLSFLRQLLMNHIDRIPVDWRNDPECLKILTVAFRNHYLNTYRLTRGWLRKAPVAFSAGFLRAWAHEPRFALRRLMNGFSWNDPILTHDADSLKRLFQEWHVPSLQPLDGDP